MTEDATPALHRVIRLASRPGEVRAVLEDDFHHFRVVLRHDGARVCAVEADAPRFPYSLCPAAGLQLQALAGLPITDDMTAIFRSVDAREQCTHQIDLAALAVTAAARGTPARRYDVVVHDRRGGTPRHALLRRDGAPVLDWTLDGYAVSHPAPFAGRGLGAGFTGWVAAALDRETAEAALVLRRGVFISRGRGMAATLDALPTASAAGGCWAQQPVRAALAARQRGSMRDFTGRADLLTATDGGWLSAAT